MPTKRKTTKPPSNGPTFTNRNVDASANPVAGSLPVISYISAVGVHITLLVFSVLFLPRTTALLTVTSPSWKSGQLTSQDRPQHPFLEPLTIDPLSTLICICLGVTILQGWWAGYIRQWGLNSGRSGSNDEQRLDAALQDKARFYELRDAILTTISFSVLFHVLLVLFGAPMASHILHTYLLALLLSILVVFPPAYVIGPPTFANDTPSFVRRMTWVRLFAEFSIQNTLERAMVYPAIGTMLGTWIGVIPIALDWDRPWQAWPLTPAYGAVGGYILASICGVAASTSKYQRTGAKAAAKQKFT